MWDKDAPVTQRAAPRSRRASMVSSHARTVLGAPSGAMGGSSMPSQSENHGVRCDGCTTVSLSLFLFTSDLIIHLSMQYILGARFQCANCPSKPKAYNLVCTIILINQGVSLTYPCSVMGVRVGRTYCMILCMSSSNCQDGSTNPLSLTLGCCLNCLYPFFHEIVSDI